MPPPSRPGPPRREATPTNMPPSPPQLAPPCWTAPSDWPPGSPRRSWRGVAHVQTGVPRLSASYCCPPSRSTGPRARSQHRYCPTGPTATIPTPPCRPMTHLRSQPRSAFLAASGSLSPSHRASSHSATTRSPAGPRTRSVGISQPSRSPTCSPEPCATHSAACDCQPRADGAQRPTPPTREPAAEARRDESGTLPWEEEQARCHSTVRPANSRMRVRATRRRSPDLRPAGFGSGGPLVTPSAPPMRGLRESPPSGSRVAFPRASGAPALSGWVAESAPATAPKPLASVRPFKPARCGNQGHDQPRTGDALLASRVIGLSSGSSRDSRWAREFRRRDVPRSATPRTGAFRHVGLSRSQAGESANVWPPTTPSRRRRSADSVPGVAV